MKIKNSLILALNCCALSLFASENVENAPMINAAPENLVSLPVEQHYQLACEAFNNNNWPEAARNFYIVSSNFPETSFGQDAAFYLAISYYHLGEFDLANDCLNNYLKDHRNPHYFLESMQYKVAIAEQFRMGAKRHYFGTKYMPKWGSGSDLALELYNEVIAAMPSHEMAAQALFSKGCLQWDLKSYNDSIESFQMVIRRFPKNELAPESYLFINKIYLEKCKRELQNSDLLALAQINLRRFKEDFPKEDRLVEAEADVMAIKEMYAKGLYETGQFYERISQPVAASLYYKKAMHDFPDTQIASICKVRVVVLNPDSQI